MPSFLKAQGFIFDTEALKDAYLAVPPSSREATSGYDEAALRALVRYFADWGPTRNSSLPSPPEDGLNDLSSDQKRDLYNELVKRLTENLRDQYSRKVDEAQFEGFLRTLSREPAPQVVTFFLQSLWGFSKRIQEYRQEFLADDPTHDTEAPPDDTSDSLTSTSFVDAIHRLPSEYLDVKRDQYAGDDKINRIRYRALETIRSDGSLPVEKLQEYQREENERHETEIMVAYDEFTVLGQLYYDYFKPRIDAYLNAVTSYLIDAVGIDESSVHHVNFTEPRNRLSDLTWFAIYPTASGDKANAYQLFVDIHWDGVRYGLYAGDDLREEGWREQVDLDNITETDALTIEALAAKFDDVLAEYYRLNGVTQPDPPESPPAELAKTVARQLRVGNQVVFYGPPGTGKTFEAQRFAEWWVHEQTDGKPRDEQMESVTFHPSFSYEDFIEGLTAEATEAGEVEYHIEDGILKRVADNAHHAYEQAESGDSPTVTGAVPPYVLIIDEINRGNLAQIFGETITLLEHDKRGSYEVSLAHSDDSFTLPPNLYIIGTMNTADRSIALVDAALRRRFRFLPFQPDYEALRTHHEFNDETSLVDDATGSDDGYRTLLALSMLALEQLNARIVDAPDLSKGQQIGHSYLWNVGTVTDLVDAWQYDILPLLEEYYFGQFDRIRRNLFDGLGEELVDWERERIKPFDDEDLASFLVDFVDVDSDVTYSSPTGGSDSTATSSRSPSPTFPEFLPQIGNRVLERVGATLQADSLDDVHRHDNFERLTFAIGSAHPGHPDDDDVRYRFLVRPHEDPPECKACLSVDNEDLRTKLADEIDHRLQGSQLPDDTTFNDITYDTVEVKFTTDEIDADPYEIDGDAIYDAFGEDLIDEAIDGFVELIETVHPVFVDADTDVTDQ